MPQQKQRLFSQEVELMGSAVLNAAETPMKVKKKAFLSNICSSEEEWPLYIVPRFYPSPGQSHEAIEAEQEGRVRLCLQVPGSFFLTLGNIHPTLSNLFPICRHLANRSHNRKSLFGGSWAMEVEVPPAWLSAKLDLCSCWVKWSKQQRQFSNSLHSIQSTSRALGKQQVL